MNWYAAKWATYIVGGVAAFCAFIVWATRTFTGPQLGVGLLVVCFAFSWWMIYREVDHKQKLRRDGW